MYTILSLSQKKEEKMKNKLIYSVLGGLLIFSLLTGCTPQATTSTENCFDTGYGS